MNALTTTAGAAERRDPLESTPARARRSVAALAMAVLVTLLAVPLLVMSATPAGAAVRVELNDLEQEQLDLLNQYRSRYGLPAVAIDAQAQVQAREWTAHLASRGRLDHDPGLHQDCAAASSSCMAWAENVGYASTGPRVFQLLAESPGHASNMRMAARDGLPVRVGIGVLQSGSRVYLTQRFYRCTCQNDDLARRLNDERSRQVAYGEALHRDLLSRAGSRAEVERIAAPLAYGVDRRLVARGVAFSDDWVGALVDSYYAATLGRSPDGGGRRYWIDVIGRGQPPAKVAAHFFASDEYFARFGTTGGWVEDLYRTLLGRRPSDDEQRRWAMRLWSGVPRDEVAYDIFQLWESRARRVQSLYRTLLGRDPDPQGWNYWTGQLANGHDVYLAIELVGSAEYEARAAQRFG